MNTLDKKKRLYLIMGMLGFLLIFSIVVFYYEKDNKETLVNTYILDRDYVNFLMTVDHYKVVSVVTNEKEQENLLDILNIEEDNYLNYSFNYVNVIIALDSCSEDVKYLNMKEQDGKYVLRFRDSTSCGGPCTLEYVLYQIPVNKEIDNVDDFEIEIKYDRSNQVNCGDVMVKKPVLYLYPEEDMNVSVKFKDKNKLLTTYPKYKNEWNVLAKKDGTLIDENGRSYYALYWDENIKHTEKFKTGFYVKSKDSIKFLEEKLFEIGLNDREANEFIMYWLPIMEEGGDNLVHFHFTDDRQKQNKIIIDPPVDTLFRFSIEIKKVNKKVSIKEQKLEKFERNGFCALEWGGSIIK